ncbi:MAG: hypothetical protein ACRETD_02635, partial [Steroidobacteraceae bacterium]
LVYWLAFAVFVVDWHAVHAGSSSRLLALFAYEFTRVPDFTLVVLWPWARTIPELGLALSMLLVLTFVRVTRSGGMTAERAALALLLSMLVAASLSEPPRVETRYTFFLYPLALILSLGTLWRLVLTFGHDRRSAPALAAGIALGGFALTEDSSRNFLLHVERAETAGGAGGGDPNMAAHLVIRPDTPAMASWLTEHVARGRDIVISGYHSLDFYYPHINYFFVDWREDNFTQWACKGGALERWSNTPLLYTEAAIGSRIPPHAHAFLVVYADQRQRLVPDLARFGARVVWAGDAVSIIELNAS